MDDMERVGTVHTFADTVETHASALAQAAHLIGVQGGPDGGEARVLAKLLIREVLTGFVIKGRYCPHGEKLLGEDVTCSARVTASASVVRDRVQDTIGAAAGARSRLNACLWCVGCSVC